ncbi:plant intracellular Ras-group-related LRR protein 6-like [Momordica charantia]|uniref:Plant intracellular Ras-group-related LRR protein 6-like n=1 Tax=Momordica charantia TaxID=3673 RepID=A0A6J1D8F0_MOMCH|nr:plant intracellular Ras-group-related LRR protein 6-like [Momordica charantia]
MEMLFEVRQPAEETTAERNMGWTAEEDQRLEIVDLSGISLNSLPNPSINLATICKLDLSNNNLQSIPESLTARLLNIIVLDVHSNQLKCLPHSIGCLTKLKILNVSGNLISMLPKTLESCRSLEELNANFNKLTKLSDTLGFELTNLKKLSVNSNKLVYLPHSISHITSLRILDARLNCLTSLPDDLENLIKLEVLNVSQNFHHLQALPYSIGLLFSLVELDISYNGITSLPDSIGCLKRLHKLCVDGNPLSSPPPLVFQQGLHAVKEYLSEKMNAGHRSPRKKKSWVGRLVRYGTFSGGYGYFKTSEPREDREAFMLSQYRSIDGLTSPRYMAPGMFSPRRLFSSRG